MFTEDLSEFLDTDDFAVTATYNGSSSVKGILDRAYVEALGTESTRPVFICEEITGLAHGDTLVIDGTSYEVVNVQPDNLGMVTIFLKVTS